MNQIIQEDMEYIRQRFDCMSIEGSTILVSGATGLIGKYLVRFLAQHCRCKVIAIVRNREKAQSFWKDLEDHVEYICSDITDITEIITKGQTVDYIIHGASITSSKSFSAHPVEVIYTSVEGTRRMLEAARRHQAKGFVFLSSMEVYGTPETEDKIDESCGTNLDTMSARNSYPESKRVCESLCAAYFSEYHVPVRVLRLTQTIGPGVGYEDSRVFAEFARCVLESRDIILHTRGDTKRSYLYLADACTAILTVMVKGVSGEAYNAANESTYCSIREMADLVALKSEGYRILVKVEPDCEQQKMMGYAPVLKMNLDTTKLKKIGWKPEIGLSDMYERMLAYMRDNFL